MTFFLNRQTFCPGPTKPHADTLGAYQEVNAYHRTNEFYEEFLECRRLLAPFMGTSNLPILLASSASGAMEAAIVNLTQENDKVLVLKAGKFGERWEKLAKVYHLKTVVIECHPGSVPELDAIKTELQKNPDLKAVLLQACETSTGVYLPVQDIAAAVKSATKALVVVDAVSSLVAHEMRMDEWQVDCVIGGSQKGFGVAPGLSFIALSETAWNKLSSRPKFYFDLAKEKAGQDKGRSSYTPATTLVKAMTASLRLLGQKGPQGCDHYHRVLAEGVRSAALELNLDLFPTSHFAQSLTAVKLPADIDGKALQAHLKKKYGIEIAGGQEELGGKILRIAHLGFVDPFQLMSAFAGLELALRDFHYPVELGKSVGTLAGRLHQEW